MMSERAKKRVTRMTRALQAASIPLIHWRSDALPTLPAIAEFVPGYEATSFFGIGAPRGTPMGIVELLNAEIRAALRDTKMKARITDLGASVFETTPSEFGRHLADETEKWGKVVKFASIKAE